VERLPERSPEPDFEGERERPSGAIGASRDGMTGSICIRLARPLLQRERYSVILDKEAGAVCHPSQNPIARSRLSDII
jgi:hypothetical protein